MISFYNADISYTLRDRHRIRAWLMDVLKQEGFYMECLNIIFCSDDYLYKMNVQYLGHKTLTDIITFDNSTKRKQINGELYISLDRARENANLLNISIKDELHRLFVHGLLHLCGYGDKTPAQKKKMTAREDFYLSLRPF